MYLKFDYNLPLHVCTKATCTNMLWGNLAKEVRDDIKEKKVLFVRVIDHVDTV